MTSVPGIPQGQKSRMFVSAKCLRGTLSDYYVLTRRYYIHKSYDRYHRLIADIRGEFFNMIRTQDVGAKIKHVSVFSV